MDKYLARIVRPAEYEAWGRFARESGQGSIYTTDQYAKYLIETKEPSELIAVFKRNTIVFGSQLVVTGDGQTKTLKCKLSALSKSDDPEILATWWYYIKNYMQAQQIATFSIILPPSSVLAANLVEFGFESTVQITGGYYYSKSKLDPNAVDFVNQCSLRKPDALDYFNAFIDEYCPQEKERSAQVLQLLSYFANNPSVGVCFASDGSFISVVSCIGSYLCELYIWGKRSWAYDSFLLLPAEKSDIIVLDDKYIADSAKKVELIELTFSTAQKPNSIVDKIYTLFSKN